MYYWAHTETFLEDRPTQEQFEDDKKFDNWLINFERKMQQRHSPPKKRVPEDFNG